MIGRAVLSVLCVAFWAVGAYAQIGPSGGGGGGVAGSFTAGDLLVANSSGQVVDAGSLNGNASVPKGLIFTNNIAYSGAYSTDQQWFTINGRSLTGAPNTPAGNNPNISPVNIYIGNDTVDTITNGPGALTWLNVFGGLGSGFTGVHQAFQAYAAIVGTPGAAGGSAVGVQAYARMSANMGGSTGAYANYKGSGFGADSNVFTTSGATFLSYVIAHEFDIAVVTGSSAAEKHAVLIIQTSNDAVRGAFDDNAINISAQDGTSTTWTTGIMFGAYAHKWSFGADSTLIGAQVRQTGPASSSIALNGVDFSAVTFQSTGCAFKSTGFCIDGPTGDALLSAAGTVSNPTLAFTNCGTNCGWYAPAASQLGLVIGGALIADSGITRAGWTFVGQVVTSGSIVMSTVTSTFSARSGGTLFSSPTNASWQSGAADAAAPVAQTFRTQSVVAGTSNTAGQNWTFIGSLSTGSGTSGDIIFQTGGTGAGATAQNTATTGLTIKGGTQQALFSTAIQIGSATALTLATGEVGLNKITASGSAPGAAGLKFEAVCGTNAGTAKIITYAGTSTTPVTIVDNVGSGVSGC
jgi:hypothetical protein